ncbi:hypothetical protein Pyn_24557 [Prunus yedoensis var. nudiflora]|uniref:Uncharacterized protein n=1 Tax=Prunus yedoensis var. nudiflora TaxID=2094558 RepID=A0A314XVA8_PRUYE|nr:hypothetical protein Pyn_24557 [Prunus yedoensis var. nudiflora]
MGNDLVSHKFEALAVKWQLISILLYCKNVSWVTGALANNHLQLAACCCCCCYFTMGLGRLLPVGALTMADWCVLCVLIPKDLFCRVCYAYNMD